MSVEAGAMIVAAVAVAYGLGFAVLPRLDWTGHQRSRYTLGGAGLVGLLFLALVVIPWFIPGP